MIKDELHKWQGKLQEEISILCDANRLDISGLTRSLILQEIEQKQAVVFKINDLLFNTEAYK